jgi:hypothetical protein
MQGRAWGHLIRDVGGSCEGRLPYSNSKFLISTSGALEGQYNKTR